LQIPHTFAICGVAILKMLTISSSFFFNPYILSSMFFSFSLVSNCWLSYDFHSISSLVARGNLSRKDPLLAASAYCVFDEFIPS